MKIMKIDDLFGSVIFNFDLFSFSNTTVLSIKQMKGHALIVKGTLLKNRN